MGEKVKVTRYSVKKQFLNNTRYFRMLIFFIQIIIIDSDHMLRLSLFALALK